MYVLPKLYISSFIDVRIPSNTELYSQFGFRDLSHAGSSPDGEFSEPVNSYHSKLSDLSEANRDFNEMYQSFKSSEEKRMKLAKEAISEDENSKTD